MNHQKKTLAHRFVLPILSAILVMGMANDVFAIPVLQLYIEGATYTDDTWVFSTTSGSFVLWVIGNVSGDGAKGPIYDVKLSAAASTAEIAAGASVVLSPTTGTGVGITDTAAPSDPSATRTLSADGAIPLLGDGRPLPSHGEFGPGTSFFQWHLGDFTRLESPLGDFSLTYPTTFSGDGQINAYLVTIEGLTSVHFDAYDHYSAVTVQGKKKKLEDHFIFAPFSHDAEGHQVPEPSALLVLGLGLAGLGEWRRRLRG